MDDLPRRIGPYTIVETLGKGGMGTVYLAEQTEPIRRTVALKVLSTSGDPERVLARYEIERQALAIMDHPSIAKVFDAGITEDGSPYVVMERVDGTPIRRYCDDHRLTIRERVTLFAEVCRAIQHAHQKGVIHRDLKPVHVLVSDADGRPLPRIIDFGIAMALGPEQRPEIPPDQSGEVVGTPGYMSPEQIEGSADIDTRTDIYSLGVILYELLAGALPHESARRGGWAAVAAQLQEIPTLAERFDSLDDVQHTVAGRRGTPPRSLRKELQSDLEWIVSRAMAKDRSRRYETAHELSLELERYLAFQPVQARGGGPPYRVRRFVRRHRVGVAFASVVTLGLVAFGLTATIQASRIARARDEAEARRTQAEGLIDFMLSELRVRLEPMGRLDILEAVGDRALEYFAQLPADQFSDEDLSSRSQALYQIGQVRLEQGRLPEAGRAFDESLRLGRELSEREPDSDEWLFGLGQAEFWAGERYRRQGDLDEALAHFQRYRDASAALTRRDPDNLGYQLEVGYSHTNVGVILRTRGDLEGALAEFSASLEAKERVAAADPGNQDRRYDVGQGHNWLGVVLRDLGRLEEARAHFETDLAIKDSLVSESPGNATARFRLAVAHHSLSGILHSRGDLSGALEGFRAARLLLFPLVERDPSNLRRVRALATAELREAHALLDLGQVGPALVQAEAAVSRQSELSARNPDRLGWRADLVRASREQVRILLALGRIDEARSRGEEAVRIARELIAEGRAEPARVVVLAQAELMLAEALLAQGSKTQALDHFGSIVDELMPLVAAGSTDADLLETLAMALVRNGQAEEGLRMVEQLETIGYSMPELTRIRELAGM